MVKTASTHEQRLRAHIVFLLDDSCIRTTIADVLTYAPDTSPIERVWWRLHEEITRNHRCQTMDDLAGPSSGGDQDLRLSPHGLEHLLLVQVHRRIPETDRVSQGI
jgi:hypothetical protein